jgi:ATP-dependent DNA helicase RecG
MQPRSVRYVKGVGPARAEQLARLEIRSVNDVLWYAPRRYEDRSRLHAISQVMPGQVVTIRGHILAKGLRRLPGGRTIVRAAVGDATGRLECVWFHQPYLERLLRVGDEWIVHGKVEAAGRRLQIIHPEIERLEDHEPSDLGLNMGRIVPIYPVTEGVSQRWLRRIVKTVLSQEGLSAHEVLPETIRRTHQMPTFEWAAQQLHFPDTWDDLEAAKRRLSFEELFLMQLTFAIRRARLKARVKPQRYQPDGALLKAFFHRLPFTLTPSQQQVMAELVEEMCRPHPMLRLLQGDVGCGKTVVAAALMIMTVQSGYQAAIMVPTELLAEQHGRLLRGYCESLGIGVRVVSQGLTARQRETILTEIARGKAQLVIGTHALIEAPVSFRNLALVVIDEQHKFGVVQRKTFVTKGQQPDVLVMTATPIPRTLALSLYGDVAVSTISQLPPGRRAIRTLWHREARWLMVETATSP